MEELERMGRLLSKFVDEMDLECPQDIKQATAQLEQVRDLNERLKETKQQVIATAGKCPFLKDQLFIMFYLN